METLSMCRICLNKDVRLHCLVNTHLQDIYERLTGSLLETKDTRPLHACYMCCARLRNCVRLRTACLHSEELFSLLLKNDSCELTPPQGMNMLQTTPVIHMSVGPAADRDLKMELSPTTDEQQHEEHVGGTVSDLQDDIIDQGIYTQLLKQEDMKSENVSSEDEELDYSIRSIKVESNSASDNSCVGDGSGKSVSKSHPSISSVDILGGKTVKIVLHRLDLNNFRKAATVAEHLNPADLEYTSQCNNLNYSENVEILKTNICKEYKKIVHTSSKTHFTPDSGSCKHMHTDTGYAIYKCHICEKIFSKKNVLTFHIRHTHNDEKPHKCDTCGRSFRKNSHLLVHIRSHTGEKPFRCLTCDKGFSRLSNLTVHIRTHTGEKPYKCDLCGKSFSMLSSLSEHIHTHTDDKPYKCHTCGRGFVRKTRLLTHIRIHTGEKPYKCDICGKGFIQKRYLSHHIGIHTGEKPYKCNICGKSFRHLNSLLDHTQTHTGEKSYKCDTCGKLFLRKSYLSTHVRIHADKKPYKCDTCGRGFITKSQLSCHIPIHTGEKPYKCDTCGKYFIQKWILSQHVRTHTGDRPYKCDTCGKSFTQRRCLSKHIRRHIKTVQV